MISTAQHSQEQYWGRSCDRQGSHQQQCLTFSEFHHFRASSAGYLLAPDMILLISPPPPFISQYESSRTFYTPQSGQSYGETNFISFIYKKVDGFQITILLPISGQKIHLSRPDQEYLCSCALPNSTGRHSHCTAMYMVPPGVMGFNICKVECRVPAPTP